jgi:hypothetical protein
LHLKSVALFLIYGKFVFRKSGLGPYFFKQPQISNKAVSQTVVHGGSTGGQQAVSEGKALQKLYQTLKA